LFKSVAIDHEFHTTPLIICERDLKVIIQHGDHVGSFYVAQLKTFVNATWSNDGWVKHLWMSCGHDENTPRVLTTPSKTFNTQDK
jgi:hypothetical protein